MSSRLSMILGDGIMSVIPILIAIRRKHANITIIALLSFFLSWTIVGWIVAMVWAIWGRSDPREYAKQDGGI